MMPAPTFSYTDTVLSCPDRMGRIVLLAMEEILGQCGLNNLLELAGLLRYVRDDSAASQALSGQPFFDLSCLQVGLESAYGPRAGRGLAQRVGRACFKYGLREFGAELGLTDLAFRLQPLPVKLKTGSEALAALFNEQSGQHVLLERDEQHIYWRIERCPLCSGRPMDASDVVRDTISHNDPFCHLAVGLLQEALYWVSGGKCFEVREEECIACGDSACTIVIDQTPTG
jgi:predicted hydrocarbon binding protein